MSYASRLVQMTGQAAPSPRPVVHEVAEHVETQASDPVTTSATSAPTDNAAQRSRSTDTRVAAERVIERSAVRDSTHEVTRVVERQPAPAEPQPRLAATPSVEPPAIAPAVVRHEVAHEWMRERADGVDPLQTLAADDELRDLLRAVRDWTSEQPAMIESTAVAPAVEVHEIPAAPHPVAEPARSAVATPRADDPVSVSIGNVTITIEDAPVARPARAAASQTSDADSRLARHYWRGR